MIQFRLINSKNSLLAVIANHLLYYPTPLSMNYTWSFGSLVGLFFVLQLMTGIFLAMHYTAHIDFAFQSVEHMMTNVHYGYLIRYMHANGASMIFILIYLHIARGLYFSSYLGKSKYLWFSGVIMFLLMMMTAFMGYVLPWGQMSFWGATVITSLVTAIPLIGESMAFWIWGGFSVNNATLISFFSLHYLLPFIITGLIFIHLLLLHEIGSYNPTKKPMTDSITFHPYYTIKDAFALIISLVLFFMLVFFFPNLLGHSDNFIPANPLVTPAHIVPEWYFTPFYAILSSCPNKLGGVIGMLAAILALFILPFQEKKNESLQIITLANTPLYKVLFWLFSLNFLILLFLGGKPAEAPFIYYSKLFTFTYFMYLLLAVPMLNKMHEILFKENFTPMKSINFITEKNLLKSASIKLKPWEIQALGLSGFFWKKKK